MSYAQDKSRMRRILEACEAPRALLLDFENICKFRTTETAEELLREVCVRHGFTKPYAIDNRTVVIRPYNLGQHHPNHHCDIAGDDPITEQSYRRGYDQGGNDILQMLKAGATIMQIEERLRQIHQWRVQPIQSPHASPGFTTPQTLPDHWLSA